MQRINDCYCNQPHDYQVRQKNLQQIVSLFAPELPHESHAARTTRISRRDEYQTVFYSNKRRVLKSAIDQIETVRRNHRAEIETAYTLASSLRARVTAGPHADAIYQIELMETQKQQIELYMPPDGASLQGPFTLFRNRTSTSRQGYWERIFTDKFESIAYSDITSVVVQHVDMRATNKSEPWIRFF